MHLNKVKCLCSSSNSEPVANGVWDDDMVAVSALPDNWIPRKCKVTLTEYLKTRENDYNDILNSISDEANVVNNDIDEKVRKLADILISDIQQNQNEMQCLIKKSGSENNCVSAEERSRALKQVEKLGMERISDLTKFKQDCFALERERADGLQKILKYKFQALINVGHKPPKDLLYEFDERVYDINQQLISNSRAYIELEAQLRLQLDESLVRAKSILNELCLSSTINKFVNSSPLLQKNHSSNENLNSDNDTENSLSKKDLNLKINDINFTKEKIQSFLEKFNDTRYQILNEFSDQISNLFKSFESNSNIESRSRDQKPDITFIDLKCDDLDIKEVIAKIISSDILNVKNNLTCLNEQFYDMQLILNNTCHLFNNIIYRFSLGQKLIVASLDDMQTSHDSIEISNEVNFNIAIEQMLNASDNDKLQQQKDFLINYLIKIPETYNQLKNMESAKIEDFFNMALILLNVVKSEIDCFRVNHRKTQLHLPENNTSSGLGKIQGLLDLRIPLLETALETDLQKQELFEYKNNFLDSLDINFNQIFECLDRQTRKWVYKMNELVNMRYSLKTMSHSIRAERVKAAFDSRLSELRFHESLLSSHLDAMYNIIDNMPIEASEYLAIDSPELYPFCTWISSIKRGIDMLFEEETIDSEVKRLKMASYSFRLLKHRQMFEESLSLAFDKRKTQIEIDFQRARTSNVNFLSQIKLFSEGGKYASAEASKTCTALVKASDALEFAYNRTLDVLNHRRLQLLSLADQQIAPLQRIVEDNLKHGTKIIYDKKILPLNKKK